MLRLGSTDKMGQIIVISERNCVVLQIVKDLHQH